MQEQKLEKARCFRVTSAVNPYRSVKDLILFTQRDKLRHYVFFFSVLSLITSFSHVFQIASSVHLLGLKYLGCRAVAGYIFEGEKENIDLSQGRPEMGILQRMQSTMG